MKSKSFSKSRIIHLVKDSEKVRSKKLKFSPRRSDFVVGVFFVSNQRAFGVQKMGTNLMNDLCKKELKLTREVHRSELTDLDETFQTGLHQG